MRAANRHGKSGWTEALPFTTQIDVSQVFLKVKFSQLHFLANISFTLFLFQIPRAESVYYEKLTNMISFKAANYPLHLTGKLETWSPSGGWQHLQKVSLKAKPFTFNLRPEAHFSNLRLRLCLESNELLCGAYSEASVVDRIEEAALLGSSGHVWLLAVIVGGLVSGLVTLILLIKCCCKSSGSKAGSGKDQEVKSRPDILPPSLSFDNKLVADNNVGGAGDSAYMERSESKSEMWQREEQQQQQDYAHYPRPEEYLTSWPGEAVLQYRGRPDGGVGGEADYRGELVEHQYRVEGEQLAYRGEVGPSDFQYFLTSCNFSGRAVSLQR